VFGVDLDAKTITQQFRGGHQQLSLVGDDVAHAVGQAAIGKRHERAAFEDDNLGVLVQTAQSSGCRGAAGNASNDDDSLFHAL